MSKGISLHLGLNAVDPAHYGGWSGELLACEADANDMASLASAANFGSSTVLLTKQATRAALEKNIKDAAQKLKAGDILFLTYSGHGGQLPDLNGDEPDAMDETWCLYDGEQPDDVLYHQLSLFEKGVRVLVLSDSCHSGSAIKDTILAAAAANPSPVRYRAMPPAIAQRTYLRNKSEYDKILKDMTLKEPKVECSALLISGCQDNQLSQDGTFNGLFTGTLKTVWNGGAFKGGYRAFHKAIVKRMPPDQTPNYFKAGIASKPFEKQKPFTVA
ncbi:MAG: caspase family protein [Rhizobiales bacterium]|nr:caspase family protein [Hyphomicrobiales bacterium]